MKTNVKAVFLAIAMLLCCSWQAAAAPFSSLGLVNPNLESSWDSTTLSGKAQYTFNILDQTVTDSYGTWQLYVNTVHLYFESDVFDQSRMDQNSFEPVTSGWSFSYSEDDAGNGYWLTGRADSQADQVNYSSAPLTFNVSYSLLSPERYYYGEATDAESSTWEWNEAQGGGSWAQEYILSFDQRQLTRGGLGWVSIDSSGGSTAPVPEPATVVLFTAGILGLIYLNRQKRRSQS